MLLAYAWRLTAVTLFISCLACNGNSSTAGGGVTGGSTGAGGGAGEGGSGGVGGFGGVGGAIPPPIAGLWEGDIDGLRVCFFVDDQGEALTRSGECNVSSESGPTESSFDLGVDLRGRDERGQPCGFTLRYGQDASIDPLTGAFGATFIDPASNAELAFSGQIVGLDASGVAAQSLDGSTCTVGWSAARAAPCDEAAVNSCLDLQNCCRAILVNPVFFESCNSVVLECNQARCLEVLSGYVQCDQLDL